MTADLDADHWALRLAALVEAHGVPGASLAVSRGDELVEAAHGVLSLRTRTAATPDALFQIGSITKVWTATLVLQLVDEGLLDLDEPIVRHLPGFRVADPDVTTAVTARHLLTHTSGLDGDFFLDTGRGDDALARYVDACSALGQTHPLGATLSYCNSGYSILGRLVEVLREATWDDVLTGRLLWPLGLETAGTLPEQALLHAAAVGHLGGVEGLVVAPVWGLYRSCGPAGLIHATARDVLAFARLHLAGGLAPGGSRLLSESSVRAMQEQTFTVPAASAGPTWGLGWQVYDWGGQRAFGHDGGTIGQKAFLRVVPDADLSICLLTNGGDAAGLSEALFRELLREEAGLELPVPPGPPAERVAVDLECCVGRYRRYGMEALVTVEDDRLVARLDFLGAIAETLGMAVPPMELVPVGPGSFVAQPPGEPNWTQVCFYEIDGVRYAQMGEYALAEQASGCGDT